MSISRAQGWLVPLLAAQSRLNICSKRCNGLKLCSGLCGLPAGCDYAAVERVNAEHLHPLLSSLVKLPFFRYFKVSTECISGAWWCTSGAWWCLLAGRMGC